MSQAKFKKGDRVRIVKDDEPLLIMGKMATVEDVMFRAQSAPQYVLRVDHIGGDIKVAGDRIQRNTMRPSSVLANDLFLPWDLDGPTANFDKFKQDNWLAGRVTELMTLYDFVVIPTVDFSIIPPLVHWLGPKIYLEMMANGRLSFVRYRGSLAYVGNGCGLNMFEILPSAENPVEPWFRRAVRCEPEEAVLLQLHNRLKGLDAKLVEHLARLTALGTVDSRLPEFIGKVEQETYRDILGSQGLRSLYSQGSDLRRLPGINANQLRVFSAAPKPDVAGDPIDVTLRLGMMNLEAYLADEAGVRDLVTDRGFGSLLRAKAERLSSGKTSADAFSALVTVEGIPDVVEMVTSGRVKPHEVWEFSGSRPATNFRQWFDKNGPLDSAAMVREYVAALHDGGPWNTWSTKLVRFVVVQGVGAIIPLVGGIAVSAADNFLLEKIRLGYNPRFFIDALRDKLLKGS